MRYLLSSLLIIISSATASQYPVISSITTDTQDAEHLVYHITQHLINYPDPAIDAIPPAGYMYATLAMKHPKYVYDSNPQTLVMPGYVRTSSSKSYSESALEAYNSQQGITTFISPSVSEPLKPGQDCIGYFFTPSLDPNMNSAAIKAPAGCVGVPPAQEWCKIVTPELVFDHGVATLEDAKDDRIADKTANLRVSCTADMQVTFNLMNTDTGGFESESINLTPSGRAFIFVDDNALNSTRNIPFSLKAGNNDLPVISRISDINATGVYYGSSVLIMEPY